MEKSLTVSQLNNYIKGVFEDELILQKINVTGEILECKVSSNSTYITLKEGDCTLNCISFSALNEYQIGQKVCLFGSVRFYNKNGKVSFIFSSAKLLGQGELLAALKKIKEKLQSEGVFSNNRMLPLLVKRIALLTSADGAALHDFLTTANSLYYLNVKVFSVRVQGERAAEEIIDTLSQIDSGFFGDFDAVIITRGGGSATDLNEFNSEALARRVFACRFTVISAVGHEVDFTLCDFASDIRVSTPTKAAEIIIANNTKFFDRLYAALHAIKTNINQSLNIKTSHLCDLSTKILALIDKKNQKKFNRAMLASIKIHRLLESFVKKSLDKCSRHALNIYSVINMKAIKGQNNLNILTARLEERNPLKILSKGYAKIYKNQMEITGVNQLEKGDGVEILMADGTAKGKIE